MNYVRSNSLSLKYQRLASSGCEDVGIRKFVFVAKTKTPEVFTNSISKVCLELACRI